MRRLLACVLLGLLLAFGACDAAIDCGPFNDKFKTADFTTAAYRIENGDSLQAAPILSPIENDTLREGAFALRMTPTQESYSSASKRSRPLGFVLAAYACLPPTMSSDEIIRDIQIYSDQAFNREYAADDDLADLFDVLVLSRANQFNYRRFDLNDFLAGAPNAADEIILVLKAAPETTSAFRFTIKYFQEGEGLDYYEFTTDPVVLEAEPARRSASS